jgi:hypothetical protein
LPAAGIDLRGRLSMGGIRERIIEGCRGGRRAGCRVWKEVDAAEQLPAGGLPRGRLFLALRT